MLLAGPVFEETNFSTQISVHQQFKILIICHTQKMWDNIKS